MNMNLSSEQTLLTTLRPLLMGIYFALENTSGSCLCFQQALLCLLPYFFFLSWSPSLCLCTVFETISSNTDEVFSLINPYANVFPFGDLNVNHKDWLTYSAGTDRLVNSAVIFQSHITYIRWSTFLLSSLAVTLAILLFWGFFLLMQVFFFCGGFPSFEKFYSCCCFRLH